MCVCAMRDVRHYMEIGDALLCGGSRALCSIEQSVRLDIFSVCRSHILFCICTLDSFLAFNAFD